ncbi:MAG TPA: UDP-glucose/GDP-mannose dehydrogenase family protein, partial [Firmicutes bacterium]|nr:UDP-glucose/GDP-mannose dehydrogenase family protein [Bacillota bacterium]
LTQKLEERTGSDAGALISVVSNPEFLREGRAVSDFMRADRVVIGGSDVRAVNLLKELYEPLEVPFVLCDVRSSELIKYASNAFLATKISFINSIARLCDALGADVVKVAEGMGYDHRIMPEHLRAGLGYGGSCFPKDCAALLGIAQKAGYDFKLLRATVEANYEQVTWVVEKLAQHLGELKGAVLGVWGLSFKPHTDDTREAPAFRLIEALVASGATVKTYDPVVRSSGLGGTLMCSSAYEAASGADAVVVATEWPQFMSLDFRQLRFLMKGELIVDGRNCLDPKLLQGLGLRYVGMGRGTWDGFGQH